MFRYLLLALLIAGCNKNGGAGAAPVDEALADEVEALADEVEALADAPEVKSAVGDGASSISAEDMDRLYKTCRTRVEGREKEGECTKDEDCGTAGCSQEVCVAEADVSNIMTTCEVLPCFAVLKSCGCEEGLCRWTVGENDRPAPKMRKAPIELESIPQ